MSPHRDGTPMQRELVQEFFERHENQWLTRREVYLGIPGMSDAQATNGITLLLRSGFLIEDWRGEGAAKRRIFRTKRGYLKTSRFEARRFPEVIWVDGGEEPIVGPFCAHCGNPSYVHGPGGECLNYRIHPLLPVGDLPAAREGGAP